MHTKKCKESVPTLLSRRLTFRPLQVPFLQRLSL